MSEAIKLILKIKNKKGKITEIRIGNCLKPLPMKGKIHKNLKMS